MGHIGFLVIFLAIVPTKVAFHPATVKRKPSVGTKVQRFDTVGVES